MNKKDVKLWYMTFMIAQVGAMLIFVVIVVPNAQMSVGFLLE